MNRKMKINAAKQERRAANNGERSSRKTFTPPTNHCSECGGIAVADIDLVNTRTGEEIPVGTICRKPSKKDLN
jgi:hypothetical protein